MRQASFGSSCRDRILDRRGARKKGLRNGEPLLQNQRFHGLFDGCGRVAAMVLIEIDMVGSQPSQAVLTFLDDTRFPGVALNRDGPALIVDRIEVVKSPVGIPSKTELRENLDLVAPALHGFSHNRLTVPLPINGSGVDGGHPHLQGLVDRSYGIPLVRPAPHSPPIAQAPKVMDESCISLCPSCRYSTGLPHFFSAGSTPQQRRLLKSATS